MADVPRRPALPRPPLNVGEAVPRPVLKDTTPIHGFEVPYAPRVEEPSVSRPGNTVQQQIEWNRRHDAVMEVLRALSADGATITATLNGVEFRVTSLEEAQRPLEARVDKLEHRDREVSLALSTTADAVTKAAGAVAVVEKGERTLRSAKWILGPLLGVVWAAILGGLAFVDNGLKERPIKAEVERIAAASAAADLALLRVQFERLNARLDAAIREADLLRDEVMDLRRNRR